MGLSCSIELGIKQEINVKGKTGWYGVWIHLPWLLDSVSSLSVIPSAPRRLLHPWGLASNAGSQMLTMLLGSPVLAFWSSIGWSVLWAGPHSCGLSLVSQKRKKKKKPSGVQSWALHSSRASQSNMLFRPVFKFPCGLWFWSGLLSCCSWCGSDSKLFSFCVETFSWLGSAPAIQWHLLWSSLGCTSQKILDCGAPGAAGVFLTGQPVTALVKVLRGEGCPSISFHHTFVTLGPALFLLIENFTIEISGQIVWVSLS